MLESIQPIILGTSQYFTVEDIARAFQVPAYCVIRVVRSGQLGGRRLGKQYIIEAEEFREWIKTGHFEYKPRPSRRKA